MTTRRRTHTKRTKHSTVTYFATYEEAQKVARRFPGSRIVHYQRGWAVQYRRSGPYYPDHP